MALRIFETKWKKALASILDDLKTSELRKLMSNLEKIPQGEKPEKPEKHREKLPDMIIKHYGPEGSISVIDKEMKELPRNDARVQEPLQSFVEELKKLQQKIKEKVKKPATESGSVEKTKPAAGKKRKREEEDEEDGVLTDVTPNQFNIQNQRKSCQPDNKKSILDLKSSRILETDGFVGKVVQKYGLRPYETKDKVKKCFFYLVVVDETASVKVKVYGKDRYEEIKEGSSYLFRRNLIKEENVILVTKLSIVSQTKQVDVPEELEMEARRLIYPVNSIKEAKLSADKTDVSVEGTITEIDSVEKTKVNHKRQKIERKSFLLKDETDSIRIVMWDKGAVGECRGLLVGDVVKLANMKTHEYRGDVSLNSTASTRIIKVQSVGIQNVRIEILGIKKATKKETQLDAEINHQLQTFVVATRLLAKTVGFKLTGDFKGSLLEKLPFSADAEIQGNKILKITAASKM